MKKQLTSITGRLGKDPVLYTRDTQDGRKPVAKFSLAVDVLGSDGTETVWWQVSAWEKRADICARNLRKGSAVQLHGFASKGGYQSKKYGWVDTLEFNCVYVTFLSRKNTNIEPHLQQGAGDQDAFSGATTANPF